MNLHTPLSIFIYQTALEEIYQLNYLIIKTHEPMLVGLIV
jgi:hypothetical protein